MRMLHTLLATILVTGVMSASAWAGKPDGGGSGPTAGFHTAYLSDQNFREFVPETDILLRTVFVSGVSHTADYCWAMIKDEADDYLFSKVFAMDGSAGPFTGNSANVRFEPGIPVAAGEVLRFRVSVLNVGSSLDDCRYFFTLNYDALN